jgi:hypothetical protein
MMTRKLFLGCVGLLGSAAVCCAQMQHPVLGYIPEGGAIRTMYGIPASGFIGGAAVSDANLDHIAVAAGGNFALGLTVDSGVPVVIGLQGPAQSSTVRGAAGGASRIVLSPRGSAALVGNFAAGSIQLISGLPDAPVVTRTLDASIVAGNSPVIAVSDDGQWVVTGSASGVYAYGPSGQPILLPVSGNVTAVAFLGGKQDIVATTSSAVTLVADIGGAAAPTSLFATPPGTPEPPDSPLAISVSADNNHVVVVVPTGAIGHINIAAGSVTGANCDCAPVGLFSLGGTVFRLTGMDGGAAKVFDASNDSVWFIPQALEVAGGAQ